MNENVKHLEEKIAYLERHVTEQDKAMLELADAVTVLRKELMALRERHVRGGDALEDEGTEERPPHY